LLAVDVLAGRQGVEGDLRVPVVGGGDQDRIDVLAVQHPAVVGVALGARGGLGAAEAAAVDVGDRGHADGVGGGACGEARGVAGAQAADTGDGHDDAVGGAGGGPGRGGQGGGAGDGGGLDEVAAGGGWGGHGKRSARGRGRVWSAGPGERLKA